MALVEDADKDVNGFTTTRRFRQKLRGTKDGNGLPIFNDATGGATQQALGLIDMRILSHGITKKRLYLRLTGITHVTESLKAWNTKSQRMQH